MGEHVRMRACVCVCVRPFEERKLGNNKQKTIKRKLKLGLMWTYKETEIRKKEKIIARSPTGCGRLEKKYKEGDAWIERRILCNLDGISGKVELLSLPIEKNKWRHFCDLLPLQLYHWHWWMRCVGRLRLSIISAAAAAAAALSFSNKGWKILKWMTLFIQRNI